MKFDEIKIQKGEFLLVCGPSAGGKTTFLEKLYKKYEEQGLKTGYVMQNFDAQIVTDKVWHELCFALENTGTEVAVMHRRVAEVCSYFGMEHLLKNDTANLSGGQKQLLNLAGVMAMCPQVLLLDEPTSQLDPVTAQNFLATVRRLNLELGITVVIAEHRLDELFAVSDRVLFVDKMQGVFLETPQNIIKKGIPEEFIPVVSRCAIKNDKNLEEIPLTVRQGRAWLLKRVSDCSPKVDRRSEATRTMSVSEGRNERRQSRHPPIIEFKNVCFSYDKNLDEVLCQMNLKIEEGEIFAGVGANGSGKSTFLRLLCGLLKCSSGKICIQRKKRVFLLPQNVKNIFTRRTVREELEECGWNGKDELTVFDKNLCERHPYDLSGGEMQKLALEKILLKRADIILLDEPTKGLDNAFKNELTEILKKLSKQGITVVLVCHDLEFCARTADRVGMIFEGQMSSICGVHEFFSGNNFYTTGINRMCHGIFDEAVVEEDVKNMTAGSEL